MTCIERIDLLVEQLNSQLTEAVAAEAGVAQAQVVRVAAAAQVARFNAWLGTAYEPHARAIAEGVSMEREAWCQVEALRRAGVAPDELPAIARAFVNTTGQSLERLVRLPSAVPGAPIVWP